MIKSHHEPFVLPVCSLPEDGEEDTLLDMLAQAKASGSIEDVEVSASLNRTQAVAVANHTGTFWAVFSNCPGRAELPVHEVDTGNHAPLRRTPHRISDQVRQVMRQEIDEMLQLGVIQRSKSAWASPVVLVPKKDWTTRFCVDYRGLNAITASDAHPMPHIKELLERHFRMTMTCPICHKPSNQLAQHLRRHCLKNCGVKERMEACSVAKNNLALIASKGTTIRYDHIMSLGCLEAVVLFLEHRGFKIIGKPTVERTTTTVQREEPSTSQSAAPVEEEFPCPPENLSATTDHEKIATGERTVRNEEDLAEEVESSSSDHSPDTADDAGDIKGSTDTQELSDHNYIYEPSQENAYDGSVVADKGGDDKETGGDQTTTGGGGSSSSNLEECTNRTAAQTRWTVMTRVKMQQTGLYRRHSLNDPLVNKFATYLRDKCNLKRYKQIVEDVARFLYYIYPNSVSFLFLKDIGKVHDFFAALRDNGLSSQTRFNYLKNIRRYVNYIMYGSNRSWGNQDDMFKTMEFFLKVTNDIQVSLTKGISKEVVVRRYQDLRTIKQTPAECRQLLQTAKPFFLRSLKSIENGSMGKTDQMEVLHYLEALLILKHLQRPGVVMNMTVSEWKKRISFCYLNEDLAVVGVTNHKTATQQVATFVLNKEEERWFEVYFEKNQTPAHKW
ncbi:unnamed protein product [Ranitomeya imitator]|uniref:Uncharacterized protein n=1 Tax=Ranitomeya imitator TaxID=111125 RepID=A0ABN9MP26_9NEOB|nr:unnamed protein product [Ranitomeya imitator]